MSITKRENKVKVNNKNGSTKLKLILSKISGAFMLPIAVMAIAGFFLGVGATIVSLGKDNEGVRVFGLFIQNLGDPVFGALPILFTAAFVVSFTNDAGSAVFSGIVGYFIFLGLQTPFITEVKGPLSDKNYGYNVLFSAGRDLDASKEIVKSQFGILSLQTSIFGAILVGMIVSYLYNKFYTIQLPQIISFFGGKRFVPLISIVAMIPLSLVFLIFWPWIGTALNYFGNLLNRAPGGLESLAFGFIERSLIPFGLHHAFYAPLWYSGVGGDVNSLLAPKIASGEFGTINDYNPDVLKDVSYITAHQLLDLVKLEPEKWQGDSRISNAAIGLTGNNIAYNLKDASGEFKTHYLPVFKFFQDVLGLKIGRYMQGKYAFMPFALPAAAGAMIMAAPKENRKMAISAVVPSALTSVVTGVTEPIEFTFLFLAPYMFWGFHAAMAGLAFMFMNLFGAHIGMSFSGGLLDLIIYGIVPVLKGTQFWWAAVIGLVYAPIYYLVFYYVIKWKNLETPGRGSNVKLFTKSDFNSKKSDSVDKTKKSNLSSTEKEIVLAFGGWDNITGYNNCASRLRYDVVDVSKVNEERLKHAGAKGVKFAGGNHVQVIFGPIAEQLNSKLSANKGADLGESIFDKKEETKKVEVNRVNLVQQQKVETKVTPAPAPVVKIPAVQKPVAESKPVVETKSVVESKPVSDGKVTSLKGVTFGIVRPIDKLEDGVFSEKMLGDGVAISVPKNIRIAKIYAPFDAVVASAFPTKHAYGLTSKEGIDVFIHIGIDTVKLSGKGFTSFVEQGQKVSEGDLIAEVDMEYVRKHVPVTDVIYTVLDSSVKNKIESIEQGRLTHDRVVMRVK
ncbi:PTS transporter subunit IIABC [Mesomycoplasma lagogenitalium]|uniref:Glucose PTS transporter subunit IIA n=1 Tax=Mesomycoplasma lagogenitalium TaxID=171286 RepID=A0ABY8LUE0_9BACT|nr:PTS transporter subunit IIABC [Mesomycoplasma lagogenitalium]WGI36330.1 glucose PTS transporter subunit IIA [Mesomycoplasma lagogenitalium]